MSIDPKYCLINGLASSRLSCPSPHVERVKDVNFATVELSTRHSFEKLQRLFDLITKQVARVKIELEIPDQAGKFQTNIDNYIESIPRGRFEGVSQYFAFHKESFDNSDLTESDVTQAFIKFIRILQKLPRITRQFYVFLLEPVSWEGTNRVMNVDYFERVCRFPDEHGEVRLLDEQGLCWLQEPDEPGQSAKLRIDTPSAARRSRGTREIVGLNNEAAFERAVIKISTSLF